MLVTLNSAIERGWLPMSAVVASRLFVWAVNFRLLDKKLPDSQTIEHWASSPDGDQFSVFTWVICWVMQFMCHQAIMAVEHQAQTSLLC